MPTLPHEPADAIGAVPVVAAQPIGETVHAFETLADELGARRPACAELRKLCGQVSQLTEELFPGDWTVKIGRDFEIPGDVFLVFSAGVTGNPDDISARTKRWHLTVHELAGDNAELFCLSFDVRR